jgi:hypothetical protein
VCSAVLVCTLPQATDSESLHTASQATVSEPGSVFTPSKYEEDESGNTLLGLQIQSALCIYTLESHCLSTCPSVRQPIIFCTRSVGRSTS